MPVILTLEYLRQENCRVFKVSLGDIAHLKGPW